MLPSSVANKPNAKKFVKFNDDGPKTYIQIKSDRRSIRNSNKIVNSSDLQDSALNMFQNKDDRVTNTPKRKYTKKDKTFMYCTCVLYTFTLSVFTHTRTLIVGLLNSKHLNLNHLEKLI